MNRISNNRRSSTHNSSRVQRGVTLVEGMIVLAITAIVLSSVAPSFGQMRERRHLEGSAAQLQTDIQYARSLAVAQNQPLRMSFIADDAGSCYVVHTGSANACDCGNDGTAACTPGVQALRSVRLPAGQTVQLHSNVRSIVFDPLQGTSTPTGTLRLVGRDDRAVHLVVNIMGRVRTCSPGGVVAGYRAC